MDRHHLNVKKAKVLLDIGSGSGKLAIQCFDRYKLDRVIGVEISSHRYGKSVAALKSYAKYVNKSPTCSASYREFDTCYKCHLVHVSPPGEETGNTCGCSINGHCRVIEMYNTDIGNLRALVRAAKPEVVVMVSLYMAVSLSS